MWTLNECEIKFREWLDQKELPYLFIEQSPDSFATLFKYITKRPDYLIVLPSIALIAVDAKERKLHESYETYVLDENDDIKKLTSFQRIFRIPVWFAFSNQGSAYRTWYWISLTEVLEKMPMKESEKYGQFRAIDIKHCITIGWEDGLEKLFRF